MVRKLPGVYITLNDLSTIPEGETNLTVGYVLKAKRGKIGEPVLESHIANTPEEAINVANKIGYPIIVRSVFILGGIGGGFADNDEELFELAKYALRLSPVTQILVEKSTGYASFAGGKVE